MGHVIVINGSPRAPISNSKKYAKIFQSFYRERVEIVNMDKSNHEEICMMVNDFIDIFFVFPLYVDGIPSTMLEFL